MPHHVTQRGNRRQQTFLHDQDYQAYKDDILVQTKPLIAMIKSPWKKFFNIL